jgi:hypothetical protein
VSFSPFENRLCRDIRNQLSESFLAAIQEKSMAPVNTMAFTLKQKKLESWHKAYIDERHTRYQTILTQLESLPDELYTTAGLLWDQALFFECHEWLEPFWFRAEGNTKKLIQALIRAAATFVLLEADRESGANKSAQKALAFLLVNRSLIPSIFRSDQLIASLKSPNFPPPKIMSTH